MSDQQKLSERMAEALALGIHDDKPFVTIYDVDGQEWVRKVEVLEKLLQEKPVAIEDLASYCRSISKVALAEKTATITECQGKLAEAQNRIQELETISAGDLTTRNRLKDERDRAIRERAEARALADIWEKAAREACDQRDALAKALGLVESVGMLATFADPTCPCKSCTEKRAAREALATPLKPKSGDEYRRMVEETAKKVDAWPDWKKPAPTDGGKV